MTYDKASFLAGLRTALSLGRVNGSDAGLGWTADPGWLVYSAGETLATYIGSTRSPFTKYADGWAICGVMVNYYEPLNNITWTGPILISTNQDFAAYNNGIGTNLREFTAVTYAGLTWYANHMYSNAPNYGGGSQVPDTDFPVIDAADRTLYPNISEVALEILRRSHARRTNA